jgi:hypothetical protein
MNIINILSAVGKGGGKIERLPGNLLPAMIVLYTHTIVLLDY